jgi:hypothetical protein
MLVFAQTSMEAELSTVCGMFIVCMNEPFIVEFVAITTAEVKTTTIREISN